MIAFIIVIALAGVFFLYPAKDPVKPKDKVKVDFE